MVSQNQYTKRVNPNFPPFINAGYYMGTLIKQQPTSTSSLPPIEETKMDLEEKDEEKENMEGKETMPPNETTAPIEEETKLDLGKLQEEEKRGMEEKEVTANPVASESLLDAEGDSSSVEKGNTPMEESCSTEVISNPASGVKDGELADKNTELEEPLDAESEQKPEESSGESAASAKVESKHSRADEAIVITNIAVKTDSDIEKDEDLDLEDTDDDLSITKL